VGPRGEKARIADVTCKELLLVGYVHLPFWVSTRNVRW
jgi:hypothetical protein